MSELTNDEIVCLEIMYDGTNMLSIGRWKEPIESLVKRGYARSLDVFNHVITRDGKTAFEQVGSSQSDNILRIKNQIGEVRSKARNCLEQAAANLVEAAKCQHQLTGESPDKVVWTLGQDIIKLALEMLK